jgi:hypothetical protein
MVINDMDIPLNGMHLVTAKNGRTLDIKGIRFIVVLWSLPWIIISISEDE